MADIETDKASMSFEAQDEFYIAKLIIDAGNDVSKKYLFYLNHDQWSYFIYVIVIIVGTSWVAHNDYMRRKIKYC